MNKSLVILGFAFAAAGALAADPMSPQWLYNLDGGIGVRSEPSAQSGRPLGELGTGAEYLPIPNLGLDLDYGFLAASKTSGDQDEDLDLSGRLLTNPMGPLQFWGQGGAGYNFNANPENGHYLGFLGAGIRLEVLSREALNLGVQYLISSPKNAPMQGFALTGGFSIPLDGPFAMGGTPANDGMGGSK